MRIGAGLRRHGTMTQTSATRRSFAFWRGSDIAADAYLPERVALLYRVDIRGLAPMVLVTAIASLALWGFIYTPLLVAWIAWFGSMRTARWLMSIAYQKAQPPVAAAARWEDYYCGLAVVFGTIWGLASMYFYSGRDQYQDLVVTFLISLIALGLPVTIAPSPKTFVGFITPMVAPLIGMLFARGDFASISVAMMMLLYSGTVLWLYLSASRALLEKLAQDARGVELARQVRETQERLTLAIKASQLMVWEWDARRDTVYLDGSWADFIGAAPGETYLAIDALKQFVHPDDVTAVEKAAIDNARNAAAEYRVEHRVQTMTGDWKWIMSRGQVVERDADGRALRMIGANIDISQRMRAEAELIATLQRERELSDMKSRFVSIASHEFRTPLATILSSSELIEHYSDTLSAAERAGVLGSIQEAVRRMVALLDDILTIGKSDAGVLKYQGGVLHLRSLCEQILTAFRAGHGKEHTVLFENNLEPDNPVEMDEKLLHHIVDNLLTNAAKYSAPGKEILLRVMRDNSEFLIEVRDQGIGIPLKDQPRLFESFFRASNVENRQGTGLGLAIVKKAVESHHGQIGFVSEPGKGTCFTVRLPLGQPSSAAPGVNA